jgi:phosphoribosylformylglycinamidine (FGAM) synthase-like enzyme
MVNLKTVGALGLTVGSVAGLIGIEGGGGYQAKPGTSVQFDTDTKSTDIAGVSVGNSDMGKMLPMNEVLAR